MALPEPARALIVEDDPVVARSIARRLLREGYAVSLAQSCRAARASGPGFQVAILDLDLPDGNGAELADELVRLGAVGGIVFYSGSIDRSQRERAALVGTIVDKSHDLEEVIQALAAPLPAVPATTRPSPAPRRRARASSPRLKRVPAEALVGQSAASPRSSRR